MGSPVKTPQVVGAAQDVAALEAALPVPTQDFIQILIDRLKAGTIFFNVNSDPLVKDVVNHRAFRHSTKTTLQAMMNQWKPGRPYIVDPLPKRMSQAFADFMANSAPIVTPADDVDRQAMVDLIRESDFNSKLRAAIDTCVSEREVWWRIYTDPMQSFWPIIEWHSRMDVRPFMYGDRCLAVAFVTHLGQQVANGPYYHHLEFHTDKRVLNTLWRSGGDDELGQEVPLTDHVLTENLLEDWNHGLPMLAGRVTNSADAVSIYDGVEDLLLALNEAHTIDAENFRLAGKKRAAIPRKYKDQAGNLNSGEEIIWTDNDWDEMEESGDIIKVMEYAYDAQASQLRKDDLERVILTRVGLAKQLVDSDANEGLAQTGTALRTRLVPGVASVEAMSEDWQDKLPKILSLMFRVDALEEGMGGWGRQWADPASRPSVVITPPIPEDPTEAATRHQTLVTSDLESVEHAVAEMHPDWSVEQRELEVRRILANNSGYALADDGTTIITADGSGVPPEGGKPIGTGGVTPGSGGAQLPDNTPTSAGAGVGAGT